MPKQVLEYELVVLVRPEFEADMSAPLKKIADLIAKAGGAIISEQEWGKKELTYKIAGETHAVYRLYRLSLPSEAPAKISAALNITDEVLRYLLTKVDEKAEAAIAAEKEFRDKRRESAEDDNESEG